MLRRVRHSLMLGALVALTVAVYQRAADADGRAGVPTLLSQTGLWVQGPESRVQGPEVPGTWGPGVQGVPRRSLGESGSGVLSPGVRAFSPQYPLWSDGAGKARWVRLPEGTTIDVSDPDRWVFPDGTRFWKEFSVGGRKVETRMLAKRDGEWLFASYAWNEAQTDATLVPEAGLTAAVDIVPGRAYRIPSVAECKACHVSGRVQVLGFSALQLSPDRDPGALHADTITPDMLTLRTLIDEGRLSPRRGDWRAQPPRIAAHDPQTRAVLGYLSANCGSCHNGASDIANLELDLKAAVSPAAPCPTGLATTLDRPGRWEIPSAPRGTSRRLTPGSADLSALLVRMRSRRPSTQMPPLGTVVVDHAAVELLTSWVEADAATWSRRLTGCTKTD